jgi:ubiquinol-cytochrome c reductase iron-sulfur subunit
MSTPDLPRREPAAEASDRTDAWRRQRERQDRAARHAAVAFAVATLAALALVAVYITGGQTQIEGLLLAIAFGGIGTGIGIWVKRIVGPQEIVEERYPMRSDEVHRDAFEEVYVEAMGEAAPGGRRRFLLRLLTAAGASLGLALLLPLRSLGPGPRNELFYTSWGQGKRLLTPEGRPLRASDIVPDQVVTVFPEGAVGSADSQAVLVGLRDGAFDRGSFAAETVDGMVVYSKICTHAGCPVGLYRARAGELLCPCHQSTFDVNRGAVVLSGPAGRPLPQLPIGTDDQGYLVALGDFTEPVGPSFWNLTETPEA